MTPKKRKTIEIWIIILVIFLAISTVVMLISLFVHIFQNGWRVSNPFMIFTPMLTLISTVIFILHARLYNDKKKNGKKGTKMDSDLTDW